MPKSSATITIEATWLDDDGRGVGDWDGLQVHVADLLPGERALVQIEHRSHHRSTAWATLAEPPAPVSADRVAPPCPAFGACGGCAWQHYSYDAQLRAKRQRVERALAAHVDVAPAICAVTPAPRQLGYRTRGKYVIAPGPNGGLVLGAYRPRSHDVVDTCGCVVVDDRIRASLAPLIQELEATGLAAYDESTRSGDLRYVVIRTGVGQAVTIGLVTATTTPRGPIAHVAQALVASGHAAGVVWVRNPSSSGAILAGEFEALAGTATVREQFGAVAVDLDIAGFTQVNRLAADAMYAALCDLVAGADRAVDLYCGTGGIAFSLAQRGVHVLGIERHEPAVSAARRAAAAAGLDTVFEAAEAETAAIAAFAPDLVVVNPPRKGLSAAAAALVIKTAPATIAYLSCAPDSLARDLAKLVAAGYAIETVQPFDLMPGTSQVETLCICRRTTPSTQVDPS